MARQVTVRADVVIEGVNFIVQEHIGTPDYPATDEDVERAIGTVAKSIVNLGNEVKKARVKHEQTG